MDIVKRNAENHNLDIHFEKLKKYSKFNKTSRKEQNI